MANLFTTINTKVMYNRHSGHDTQSNNYHMESHE